MTHPELIDWAKKNKGADYMLSKIAEAVLKLDRCLQLMLDDLDEEIDPVSYEKALE